MQKEPQVMVLGTGRAVPERVLSNADLEQIVETSDSWIMNRTGIRERRIAESGTGVSVLAAEAAREALDAAGLESCDIDLIIVGTVTGDMKFPSTACLVQERLGAGGAVAFDLSAACCGFLYSLQVAEGLMTSAGYRHALVIGAEVTTSMVDWQDRDTCVLFGDGAGAVVLGPSDGRRGVLQTHLGSNGAHHGLLYNAGCGSLNPPTPENAAQKIHTIRMEGREVFRHAVTAMTGALNQVLGAGGVEASDLDLLIPHQANLRIIEAVGKRFSVPAEKVFINVDRYGNTSSASIPIALAEARQSGRLKEGDLVGMVTFGAGLTWAAGLLRF